ncbi:MAG: TIGR03757 family integrating conjugative element protein [Halieaceae bacterium]|uniref:TIGR03757 family integrating conjugative element protein n=1 Tax=Haliea alexandrii TaxID=2448162 RepID=UPI001304A420|nr:TIGR03757 family integrating conjugative element protein [Haliea alexandrii]MCR9184740.1 TIGR03757 family integrating conjugative element protein [Halieaceae bacterium]
MARLTYTAPTQPGSHVRCGGVVGPLARLALLTTLLTSPFSVAAPRYQVELFTIAAHPPPAHHNVTGEDIQLTVYHLDGLARLNATLSHQLPPQQSAAKAMAATRLGALTERQQADLRATATGLLAAQRYGLTRYPAMVVNGEAVYYGLTDPTAAVRQYQRWRGEAEL